MAAVVTVAPEPGLRPLKTVADFRALLHGVAMAAVPLLVVLGVGTDTELLSWIAVAFAALDPLLSLSNTADAVRKAVYGLGGLTQAVLIAIGTWQEAVVTQYVGGGITFLVALVAVLYTPTTTVEPA